MILPDQYLEALRRSTLTLEEFKALDGYPWLPCPICRGVEGCDHSIIERARFRHPGIDTLHPITA